MFPASLSDISLGGWIAYCHKLQPLSDELTQLNELPASKRKEILLSRNYVNKAFESAAHFELSGDLLVEDVLKLYEAFCSLFAAEVIRVEMPDISQLYCGQFVDAKQILSAGKDRNKWELLQYVCVIFCLQDGVVYDEQFTSEENTQFREVGNFPLDKVLAISKWWDELNDFINNNYTLFQDSGEDEGENMKAHMERWGWTNFIVTMAKTKVFDIPGGNKNSIDCVRATKLEDVLIYASQEKDLNIAVMRDMQTTK